MKLIQQQLEAKYEDEKRRCLLELEGVRKRSTEKEALIQKAARWAESAFTLSLPSW